jgi:hypothetical protein
VGPAPVTEMMRLIAASAPAQQHCLQIQKKTILKTIISGGKLVVSCFYQPNP